MILIMLLASQENLKKSQLRRKLGLEPYLAKTLGLIVYVIVFSSDFLD